MRNALLILMVSILLLPIVPGCGGGETRKMMDRADSLIVSDPEVALAILDDIPESSRSGGAAEARYNMLHTEASYRAFDDTALNDSVIAISVDYYEKHNDPNNISRARYNAAMVNIAHGSYTKAIVNLLMAEFYSLSDTSSHFRNASIQRSLGDCYLKIGDQSSSKEYYKKACSEFLKANEPRYAAHISYKVAASYVALDSFAQVDKYLSKTRHLANITGDSLLYDFSEALRGQVYYQQKNYQAAIRLFESLREKGIYFSDREINFLGNSYLETGQLEKARKCLDELDSISGGNIYKYSLSRHLSARENDFKQAYLLLDKRIEILNAETDSASDTNFLGVVGDYYNSERKKITEELGQEKIQHLWIVTIIIFIALIVLMLVKYRSTLIKRKMNEEILEITSFNSELMTNLQKQNYDSERLKNQLSDKNGQVAELENQLENERESSNMRIVELELRIRSDKESSDAKISEIEYQIELERISSHAKISVLEEDLQNLRNCVAQKESALKDTAQLIGNINEKMHSTQVAYEREQDKTRKMNMRIRTLLLEKYKLLDKLCDEYSRKTAKTTDQTRIYKRVMAIIDSLREGSEIMKELETTIDTYLDGLISDLRSDFPNLSGRDLSIYMFTAVGLSAMSISTILKINKNIIYITKTRMRNKFGEAISRSGVRYRDILI